MIITGKEFNLSEYKDYSDTLVMWGVSINNSEYKKTHDLKGKNHDVIINIAAKSGNPIVLFLGGDDIAITKGLSIIMQSKHNDIIIIDNQHGINSFTERYEGIIKRYRENYTFELFNKNGNVNSVMVCRPKNN